MTEVIKAVNLQFGYTPGELLLKDLNLNVRPGDFLGLIGPNGSGKTTILKLLSGFLRPFAGRVLLRDREILALSNRERARLLAVVPQFVMTPMPYTVRQVVEMGRISRLPLFAPLRRADRDTVEQAIDDMDLRDLRLHRFNELSGGERQRVIIAAALAQEPELLLLDEPTASLDLGHKTKLMRILKKLQERGIAIMVISHDIELTARYCSRLTLLWAGEVLADGPVSEVIRPHLIKQAYDCEVEITTAHNNIPQIIPVLE
ncbi:MAG: ABC transporter ATP-binding protein [Victivallaceae bacterium]|nr:ABC transporter ATP-binding protein [Victivallaceae bacterium]